MFFNSNESSPSLQAVGIECVKGSENQDGAKPENMQN